MSNLENIQFTKFNDTETKILMSIKKINKNPNNVVFGKNQLEQFFEIIENIEVNINN